MPPVGLVSRRKSRKVELENRIRNGPWVKYTHCTERRDGGFKPVLVTRSVRLGENYLPTPFHSVPPGWQLAILGNDIGREWVEGIG